MRAYWYEFVRVSSSVRVRSRVLAWARTMAEACVRFGVGGRRRRFYFEWQHSCSIQASRCVGGCGDKAPVSLVWGMCVVRPVSDSHSPMDCGGYPDR